MLSSRYIHAIHIDTRRNRTALSRTPILLLLAFPLLFSMKLFPLPMLVLLSLSLFPMLLLTFPLPLLMTSRICIRRSPIPSLPKNWMVWYKLMSDLMVLPCVIHLHIPRARSLAFSAMANATWRGRTSIRMVLNNTWRWTIRKSMRMWWVTMRCLLVLLVRWVVIGRIRRVRMGWRGDRPAILIHLLIPRMNIIYGGPRSTIHPCRIALLLGRTREWCSMMGDIIVVRRRGMSLVSHEKFEVCSNVLSRQGR